MTTAQQQTKIKKLENEIQEREFHGLFSNIHKGEPLGSNKVIGLFNNLKYPMIEETTNKKTILLNYENGLLLFYKSQLIGAIYIENKCTPHEKRYSFFLGMKNLKKKYPHINKKSISERLKNFFYKIDEKNYYDSDNGNHGKIIGSDTFYRFII